MATPSTQSLNAQFESRDIRLELIDEPETPERETMEEIPLAELADNIAAVGLIKPLIVKPVAGRFETVAGHRRLLACRLVEYSPVPCRVVVNGVVDPLAILVSENAHVEAVNPVEEARFYAKLLDAHCAHDVDALCIAVKRRREFVEDRLNLLRGWPRVIDALQAKRISFAVARELNKVKDPNRLNQLLDVAINQGASARAVAEWRQQTEHIGPLLPPDGAPGAVNGNTGPVMTPYQMKCLFCEGTEETYDMEMVWLHRPCKRVVDSLINRLNTRPAD